MINTQLEDAHPFDSLCFLAYDFAAAQLAAAEDNIQAAGTLLLEGTATVAPFVLGRAAIEASGRAALFLEPSISDRERARLVFAERLNELRELRRLMVAHDPKGTSEKATADIRKVDEGVASIEAYAEKHGVVIPHRPRFTDVVRRILAADGERDFYATLAVGAYSSVAHAVPDMLVAHTVDPEDPQWQPFAVGFVELEDKFVMDLVIAILTAYSRTVTLQIDAYEWPPSAWKRWVAHVRATLRRALAQFETGANLVCG